MKSIVLIVEATKSLHALQQAPFPNPSLGACPPWSCAQMSTLLRTHPVISPLTLVMVLADAGAPSFLIPLAHSSSCKPHLSLNRAYPSNFLIDILPAFPQYLGLKTNLYQVTF